jgi:serine/threonine protein kinase
MSAHRANVPARSYCVACAAFSRSEARACESCGEPLDLDGRYRIESPLAHGEKATTFRGRRLSDGAPVCLKRFHFASARNFDIEEHFHREARILRQLSHPDIPAYVDDFTAGEGSALSFWLVQDLVDGRDLAAEMEFHRYTEVEALETARGLLPVLEYLHGLSPPVVHRDLKPSNVLRSKDGRLALVDFGAVRDAFVDPESLGDESLGYMPGEQLRGSPTPASDLYALGVLVLVLLSRREPHHLLESDGRLTWRGAIHVKPETGKLLDALLEPRVEKRVQSVADVRPLLSAALDAARGVRRPEPDAAPKKKSSAVPVLAAFLLLSGVAAAVGTLLATSTPQRITIETPHISLPKIEFPKIEIPSFGERPKAPSPSASVSRKTDVDDDDEDAQPAKVRRGRTARRGASKGTDDTDDPTPADSLPRATPKKGATPPLPPPPRPPKGAAQRASFPAYLQQMRPMSELAREIFKRDFPGTILSGRGTIDDIARCRGAVSSRWGKQCVEVRLRQGGARITLYYGAKDEALTSALSPGAEHRFARCTAVATTTWSARCDMP